MGRALSQTGAAVAAPAYGSVRCQVAGSTFNVMPSLPTTRTASPYADAYLWISRPGLSSNGHSGMRQCTRGPGGNVFWPPKAHQEARLAIFEGQPPWPPAPL